MPTYDPSDWNDAGHRSINNCYNYATNTKNEPPGDGEQPPKPAHPGRSKDITARILKNTYVVRDPKTNAVTGVHEWDFTCRGVKTAAMADGLKELKDGGCDPECWKVAYFVRHPDLTKRLNGDFHFVRQDDGGGWSHKQGDSNATNRQYNPDTGNYDGEPINDPATDNVGVGYEFCGYLCVCSDAITIASLPNLVAEGESGVAVAMGGTLGSSSEFLLQVDGARIAELVTGLSRHLETPLEPGPIGGTLLYRLDTAGTSYFVTDIGVGMYGTRVHHLRDASGLVVAAFSELIGALPFDVGPASNRRLGRFRKTVSTQQVLSENIAFSASRRPGFAIAAVTLPASLLAAIRIDSRDYPPSDGDFTAADERSKVTDSGNLPDGCIWTLSTETRTAVTPSLDDPNCVDHHYKTIIKLVVTCAGSGEEKKAERTTTTGPHCGDPHATPPVVPQPNQVSRPVSTGPSPDGKGNKTVFTQPDGTKVTIEEKPGESVKVTVEFPDGTTVEMSGP